MTNSPPPRHLGPPRGRPTRRAIFDQFAAAVSEITGRLPNPTQATGIWHDLWQRDTHHSTAIEGNTLLQREVNALLDHGRTLGAKELAQYMEVLGYSEAATWVYEQGLTGHGWEQKQLITLTEIRHVHALVMGRVWQVAPHPSALPQETPGSFRHHDIRSFPGGMTPPAFPLIGPQLTAWLDRANEFGSNLDTSDLPPADAPLVLARLHCDFERIHPFLDGNGRTGRLVLNLLLVRLGWPPMVILKTQRQRYLTALDQADRGDPGPLAELLARAVIDSTHRLVPPVATLGELVPLKALASAGLSLAALKQAATRGRLVASRDSTGQWLSSRAAVEDYLASRYRRSA